MMSYYLLLHFLKSIDIFINETIKIVLYAKPFCKHERKIIPCTFVATYPGLGFHRNPTVK